MSLALCFFSIIPNFDRKSNISPKNVKCFHDFFLIFMPQRIALGEAGEEAFEGYTFLF